MCGIFGYMGYPIQMSERLQANLSQLLQHRGPNDHGFEGGPGWGLGFRRLSILDLSPLGHQPMSSPDKRYWINFNGEIYNYVELRRELEQKGETFRGTSDTEVLLRLLALEGPAAISKLNGMFAFCFVDTVVGTFIMARDRLGVKPLYYQTLPGQLRFASELKILLAWPDATFELNQAAILEYFAFHYLPNETCIFKGYQKLAPGCYLSGSFAEPHRAQSTCYWKVSINDDESISVLTPQQLDDLLNLLTNAVQIRLRSDVPVGVFLSGGIDSGLITALAAQSNVRPLALTIGFNEAKYNEVSLATATARHVGLEQQIIPQPPSSIQDVDQLSWFFDEPFGDSSSIPTFNLCKAAAEYATVFLSGDGGDEAFGGYTKYFKTKRARLADAVPAPIGQALQAVSTLLPRQSLVSYWLARTTLPPGGLAETQNKPPIDPIFDLILTADFKALLPQTGKPLWDRWQQYPSQSLMARQQWLDYTSYLPDDILVKVDRASMAHSIEVRSPLIDYRLVEWAARLPRTTLFNSKHGKVPLRDLSRKLLPNQIQQAAKRGFGAPLGDWFKDPAGQKFARERLLSNEAHHRGLWNTKGVESLLNAHQSNSKRNFGGWLWRLLMLDSWARHYYDSKSFLQNPPNQKN